MFRILLFVLVSHCAFSQITGKVVDDKNEELPGASVIIFSLPDSVKIAETMTDINGEFQLKFTGNKGLLRISYIGLETLNFPYEKGKSVGEIKLFPATNALKEVTVAGRRPTITQEVDRTVVSVEGSVITEGNNLLEMMEKMPGLTVQNEGTFAINGKAGVTVMIDGKITHLNGSQLATLLRGIQASDVSQVELMSSPSARQDAQGSGGIINIKMKRNKALGLKGDVWVRGSHTRLAQGAAGAGISYKTEKMNIYVSGSRGYDQSKASAYSEQFFGGEVNNHAIQLENSGTKPGNNYGIRTGIEIINDTTSEFEVSFNWIAGRYISFLNADRTLYGNQQSILQKTLTSSHFDEAYNNLTFNLSYLRRFTGKDHELRVNVDYAPHGNDYDNRFDTDFQGLQNLKSARKNVQDWANTTYMGGVDYKKPVGDFGKLEAGWKATYLWIDNSMINDTLSSGSWVRDFSTTNQFKYGQHLQAGYLIYAQTFGKVKVQAGVRGEYTGIRAEQLTLDEVYTRSYFDLFPNAYLSRDLDRKNSLRLAYSRRINRPGDHDVNSFRVYDDPFNYSSGNPNLGPSKTSVFEFTHSFDNKVFTTLTYSDARDVITYLTGPGDTPNSTFTRPENVGKFVNYGFNVMYNSNFYKWWTANHYFTVFKNEYTGKFEDVNMSNESLSWSLNTRHTLDLNESLRLEVLGVYNSPVIRGVYRSASRYNLDLSLSQMLLNKKANIKLGVTGLLRQAKPESSSNFGMLRTYGFSRPDNRKVLLTFSYRIG
jgi:RNase P/RNase MRP subunit p29